jgi:hypothetical protein
MGMISIKRIPNYFSYQYLIYLFIYLFVGLGFELKASMFAKQAFYHLNHASRPHTVAVK